MIIRIKHCGGFHISIPVLLLLLGFLAFASAADKDKDKPTWAKKDIRDYSEADLERLYDQWEDNDDEPLPEDELPEYKKPPKEGANIPPFDKLGKMSGDEIMKLTKKGKTVMVFVTVSGDPTRQECEELTSMWQMGLRNNHIQAERYVIEDHRAIFLFHDGAQAWDAKEFLLEQDRLRELTIEGQAHQGKGAKDHKVEKTEL